MKQQVEKALDKIRPMLQADGGDVKLIAVDDQSGVVTVQLTGACGTCPFAQLTLKQGIEQSLKEQVPAVTEVRSA